MTNDALAALRQAAEAVRAQIPTGGLTVASVERLLRAADAVCATEAAAGAAAVPPSPSRASKRREARERWAEIARRNAAEAAAPARGDRSPATGG